MYAIVEVSGKQYRVEKDITINVDRLGDVEGDSVTLDKVLLVSNGSEVRVGQPYLSNVTVKASFLGDVKGRKVLGIKFKKRKNYERTVGHRTIYSRLRINDIVG